MGPLVHTLPKKFRLGGGDFRVFSTLDGNPVVVIEVFSPGKGVLRARIDAWGVRDLVGLLDDARQGSQCDFMSYHLREGSNYVLMCREKKGRWLSNLRF